MTIPQKRKSSVDLLLTVVVSEQKKFLLDWLVVLYSKATST